MKRKHEQRVGRVIFGAQNPLARSIHLAPNPTPGFEVLDDPLSADDSPEVSIRKIRKIQAAAADLIKNKDATAAEIKRIGDDLSRFTKIADQHEEVKLKAEQALQLARSGAATVPDSLSTNGLSFIRALASGSAPDDEFCKLAHVQEIKAPYFNLISKTDKEIVELGAPPEVQHLLARLRRVNDTLLVMGMYFSLRDSRTFVELGGVKKLYMWREWEELFNRVKFVMDEGGGGTSIAPWVPTIWSGNLNMLVQIAARCAAYFPSFPMQSLTQKAFVEGADLEAKFIAESGAIGPQDFTAFDATWTARKMAALCIASREITQDSAIPFVQEVERKMSKALGRGKENLLLNGQRTGTSPPGPGSLDSGQTIQADDVRMLSNGLRYWHAQTGTGVKDAGAGLTIEACAKLRGPMGAYGVEPNANLWICSAWGAAHLLTLRTETGLPVFLSPMGNAASPPGTVGRLLDSDICISAYVNDDYNSAGVRDGVGATTAIYYPNVQQFVFGERLGIVVEASPHFQFNLDNLTFKAVMRLDLQPVRTPSAADPMIAAIGNLALA